MPPVTVVTTTETVGVINETLNHLEQDDPRLVQAVKNHYLRRPSTEPHNFSKAHLELDGQFGQAGTDTVQNIILQSVPSNCSMASLNPLPSFCAVPGKGREAHSQNPSSSLDGTHFTMYCVWQVLGRLNIKV